MSILFNHKLSIKQLMENETSRPFSIETFHSNLKHIKDNTLYDLIEICSFSDTIQSYIFHHGSFNWDFKEYTHLLCVYTLLISEMRAKRALKVRPEGCNRTKVKKQQVVNSRFKLSQTELSWIKKFNLLDN